MGLFFFCKGDSVMEKTPKQWSQRFNIELIDIDGWRGRFTKDINEPISEQEFIERMMESTVKFHPIKSST